jgi:hypothetical protein
MAFLLNMAQSVLLKCADCQKRGSMNKDITSNRVFCKNLNCYNMLMNVTDWAGMEQGFAYPY